MTTDTDRWSRLAALLRAEGRSDLADIIEKSAAPEPAVYWSQSFEWAGGECPLPDGVRVRWHSPEGSGEITGQSSYNNWEFPGKFSYAADNPELWLPLPKEWKCANGVWYSLRKEDGTELICHGNIPSWLTITHVRLPTNPRAKPETPDGWREGYDAALAKLREIAAEHRSEGSERWARFLEQTAKDMERRCK